LGGGAKKKGFEGRGLDHPDLEYIYIYYISTLVLLIKVYKYTINVK